MKDKKERLLSRKNRRFTKEYRELFDSLITDFVCQLAYREATLLKYEYHLAKYLEYLDHRKADVSTQTAEEYIEYMESAGHDGTIISVCAGVLNRALIQHFKLTPLANLNIKIRSYDPHNFPLSDDDFRQLIKNLTYDVKQVLWLCRETDIAATYLMSITHSDVNLGRKTVRYMGVDHSYPATMQKWVKLMKEHAKKLEQDDKKKGIYNPGYMFTRTDGKMLGHVIDHEGHDRLGRLSMDASKIVKQLQKQGEMQNIKGAKLSNVRKYDGDAEEDVAA